MPALQLFLGNYKNLFGRGDEIETELSIEDFETDGEQSEDQDTNGNDQTENWFALKYSWISTIDSLSNGDHSKEISNYKNQLEPFPAIENITKTKIIEHLASRKDIHDLTNIIAKQDEYHYQELYSLLFLMLWEKSDEYLISSYQEDKIAGLIFSILFKAFNSNHSSFYYKIKRPSRNTVNLDNCPELEQTPDETTLDNTDQQIIWMRQAINQLQCYDRRIMEFYLELNCNLSATARKMQ
ncbi:MAG TPA: hypothetical protein VK553_03230, partial [Candidatus Nitrosopolaris rasttigaisensis]|nr:hypothetical protein [Candidatus Nitrosopolaris rasttigaisensis]